MVLKRLGEILVDTKLITESQLRDALEEQKRTKEYLGGILVKKNFIKEDDLMNALSAQFNIPLVHLKDEVIDWDLCMQYATEILAHQKVLPIFQDEKNVIVAVRDPLDKISLSNIEMAIRPRTLRLVLVCESELNEFIKEVKRRSRANLKGLLDDVS